MSVISQKSKKFTKEVGRLTESDFRRLEVVRSSLGIYYYEVVSPGSGGAGIGRFSGSRGGLKTP